jgi:hypothetical protein
MAHRIWMSCGVISTTGSLEFSVARKDQVLTSLLIKLDLVIFLHHHSGADLVAVAVLLVLNSPILSVQKPAFFWQRGVSSLFGYVVDFFIIQEGQAGVVMTFGKYDYTAKPGINWRMPWPIQTDETVNLSGVRSV